MASPLFFGVSVIALDPDAVAVTFAAEVLLTAETRPVTAVLCVQLLGQTKFIAVPLTVNP